MNSIITFHAAEYKMYENTIYQFLVLSLTALKII